MSNIKPEDLDALIQELHSPEELDKDGMVYQIWEDGEITLQKSGSLLWQRILHQLSSPLTLISICTMPMKYGDTHSYTVVKTYEDAMKIREMMKQYITL